MTLETKETKEKPQFSMERLMVVFLVFMAATILGMMFIPRNVGGAHLLPGLYAMMTTIFIFNLRDRRQRGEISLKEFRRKLVFILIVMSLFCAVLLAPFFIWPEAGFKMFLVVAVPMMAIMATISTVVARRKKRAAQPKST